VNIQLWEDEKDAYFKGDFNQELLEKIQLELQVTLPESYINLMKKRNGFYLTKRYFPTSTPNSWANNSVHIDFLFGIGEEPGILDTVYLRKEWGISSKKLVIISAEPPMFICLDYRRRKNPSVLFLDVDENQEIQLAANFESFLHGLVEEIAEDENGMLLLDHLSAEQINQHYHNIDQVIQNGKPKEIDKLFTKILSTNNELIRYMVEKMRQHEKPKVHFYLLLFLWCCAEGDNQGIIPDDYLVEVLNEFSHSKNKEVKAIAETSLQSLKARLL
jgi:hypothetical protein